jgi:DNA polymerase zeta
MSASPVQDRSQFARSFAIRIVALDYNYVVPSPALDPVCIPLTGEAISKVCVLRVFGSTPSGQKTCLHVHQVSFTARLQFVH